MQGLHAHGAGTIGQVGHQAMGVVQDAIYPDDAIAVRLEVECSVPEPAARISAHVNTPGE